MLGSDLAFRLCSLCTPDEHQIKAAETGISDGIGDIMSFEWDPRKARANQRKHGVTFEEASSALRDRLSATGHDPDHSEDEDRFVTFGVSSRGRLLTVSHTDRGNTIRIISARIATSVERQIYEEDQSRNGR